ncbi:MAG: thioredoxin family protein [Candidatus Acetothermia bacterium]|jgi:small redox-active disulfide protein 2|nr:thioredoxin family protein [Candidatus Acetothermia bacterium]MDH7505475.1 thioredoxin family protein [Candidatus Acetothermia bacterium]
MKIEVLGTGCPKCERTLTNAKQAVAELGLNAEVVKVYDLGEITARGVLLTPALAIDGQVKVSGHIPSVEEIKRLLQG